MTGRDYGTEWESVTETLHHVVVQYDWERDTLEDRARFIKSVAGAMASLELRPTWAGIWLVDWLVPGFDTVAVELETADIEYRWIFDVRRLEPALIGIQWRVKAGCIRDWANRYFT